MPLKEIVILRCNDKFKTELEAMARKMGVSSSALIRNSVALAILPPERPSEVEKILAKIKHERDEELYGKGDAKDNGHE